MYSEDDVEDEKIRAAYLVNLLGSFGQHVGLPEAEEIIKEATASNNTFISKKEFNEMIAKNDEDDDALTVFALFDKDGDGEITAAELRYQLTELKEHMTDDQVDEMIRLADSDGNGKVSFVEFRNMMQMLNSKKHVEVAKTISPAKTIGVSDQWKSVNHIALVVADVGRSATFYGGVLGMKQIMRPDFDRHGAWFTLGNIDLHLILGIPAVHPDDDLIVSHIALNCGDDNDVMNLIRRLKELGVPFRENISVPNPATKKQVKQAFVTDPDGYYLEFCSCEPLEEMLTEQLARDKSLWNFQRVKAVTAFRSQVQEWVNMSTTTYEWSTNYIKQKANFIKEHSGEVCQNFPESEVADLLAIFQSTSAVLSVLKNKENVPAFQIRIQDNQIDVVMLLFAAHRGNLAALEVAAQSGLDMNCSDYDHRTALHLACAGGHLDCVQFLIGECRVDTSLKDRWGFPALKDAMENNHTKIIEVLHGRTSFLQGMESNDIEINGRLDLLSDAEKKEIEKDILEWAINETKDIEIDEEKLSNLLKRQKIYGDVTQNATKEELSYLLGIFKNVVPHVILALKEKIKTTGGLIFIPPAFYERDETFFQPDSLKIQMETEDAETMEVVQILYAASCGNLIALKNAHENEVDLSKCDYDQRTALHLACAENHLECIKFLVDDAGVELDPRDRWGTSPLEYAAEYKNEKVVEILSRKIRHKQHIEVMELLFAASQGDVACLKKAYKEGRDLSLADYDGRTALHLAVAEEHVHCVRFLMDIGSDLDKKDRWGQKPQAVEFLNGCEDILRDDKNAKPNKESPPTEREKELYDVIKEKNKAIKTSETAQKRLAAKLSELETNVNENKSGTDAKYKKTNDQLSLKTKEAKKYNDDLKKAEKRAIELMDTVSEKNKKISELENENVRLRLMKDQAKEIIDKVEKAKPKSTSDVNDAEIKKKCKFENTGNCRNRECKDAHPKKTCQSFSKLGSCPLESTCEQADGCKNCHPLEMSSQRTPDVDPFLGQGSPSGAHREAEGWRTAQPGQWGKGRWRKRITRRGGRGKQTSSFKDTDKWTIYLSNIRGYFSKCVSFQNIVSSIQPSVIALNETHFKFGKKMKLQGFNSFSRNRQNKCMGGISTSVKNQDAMHTLKVKEGIEDDEDLGGIFICEK